MKRFASKISIKNFILLWMSGLVLCFIILSVSLILSKNRLQRMGSRISSESRALDVSRRLNTSILDERREDLLWRATRNDQYRLGKDGELQEVGVLIKELHSYAASPSEKDFLSKIERNFVAYRIAAMADPPPPIEEVSDITDSLLQDVRALGDKSRKQVTQTIEASNRLNSLVDFWSLIVTLFAVTIVTLGSIALIRRILPPTLSLVHAAQKFGRGDFTERIEPYREDELGMLCKTFNRMAEDLSNLLKDRMNFVAAVAHDLRNPLIVIGGGAHRLKKKLEVPNEHAAWLDRIIEQAGYLDKLIQDLMDSSRIETGNLALQKSEIEMTSFVRGIQETQKAVIPSHRIVFEGGCECYVHGDRGRLERVITNLVSNAVKYSENGSTVLLKVERSQSNALISVKDEGVGIDEHEIQELFQPFRRLSRTREMAQGTGLGLFSARKIVEAHGGSIRISSESGNGTTVEILLPMKENPKMTHE